eukprot:scaffold742_cov395-Prasinococcus_capsulatus_cf.AAC.22
MCPSASFWQPPPCHLLAWAHQSLSTPSSRPPSPPPSAFVRRRVVQGSARRGGRRGGGGCGRAGRGHRRVRTRARHRREGARDRARPPLAAAFSRLSGGPKPLASDDASPVAQ